MKIQFLLESFEYSSDMTPNQIPEKWYEKPDWVPTKLTDMGEYTLLRKLKVKPKQEKYRIKYISNKFDLFYLRPAFQEVPILHKLKFNDINLTKSITYFSNGKVSSIKFHKPTATRAIVAVFYGEKNSLKMNESYDTLNGKYIEKWYKNGKIQFKRIYKNSDNEQPEKTIFYDKNGEIIE